MATITAASRKPLRAAGASARAGAGWVDTFAVRTEPFIGKCFEPIRECGREQSRGTTRPRRGTSRPDCGIVGQVEVVQKRRLLEAAATMRPAALSIRRRRPKLVDVPAKPPDVGVRLRTDVRHAVPRSVRTLLPGP